MFSIFGSHQDKFDETKFKANLRMAGTRIKMVQAKMANSIKLQRRAIAELLALGKFEAARIKVEPLVREDKSVAGLEALAVFCDTIGNRVHVVGTATSCPPELKEAITSVIWASRQTDLVPELHVVREQIAFRFGRKFTDMAQNNEEFSVNQRILDRLSAQLPGHAECVEYLKGICEEYQVSVDLNKLEGAELGSTTGTVPLGMEGEVKRDSSGRIEVPPIVVPRDDIEARLLALKRQ